VAGNQLGGGSRLRQPPAIWRITSSPVRWPKLSLTIWK
jgi:hypothetical protein